MLNPFVLIEIKAARTEFPCGIALASRSHERFNMITTTTNAAT
jgi:hypothetical protein